MINILFALVALGALCIDIILNRGLIEEIEEEQKTYNEDLSEHFKKLKLRKARILAQTSKDKIDTLSDK